MIFRVALNKTNDIKKQPFTGPADSLRKSSAILRKTSTTIAQRN